MNRNSIEGIVSKVEKIDEQSSLLTLKTIKGDSFVEVTVPIYNKLDERFKGLVVRIHNERAGFFGWTVAQTINSPIDSIVNRVPYFYAKCIARSQKD